MRKEELFMKGKIFGLMIITSILPALAFTVGAPAAPNTKALPAVAAATPLPAAANAAEPHPEIRDAIGALRRAKEHMEHAAHDFGGHRVEAIRATDAALHQLEECLRYDRN
jgi:hypothetical protein